MKLIIEGLKPMYAEVSKVLKQVNENKKAFAALDCMIEMLCSSSTVYEDMRPMQMLMFINKDMSYVKGEMSPAEEEEHIEEIYKVIEEKEKELDEFIRSQNSRRK